MGLPARRIAASLAMLVAGGLLLAASGVAGSHRPTRAAVSNGGTLRIAVRAGGGYRTVDPTLSFFGIAWPVLDATCELLMRYPDKSPPAGYTPVPGAATGYPKVSPDGKTYTFTIRRGLRFNTGERLTARNFAWAMFRDLSKVINGFDSIGYGLDTIVGSEALRYGNSTTLPGVQAKGYRLTLKLTRPTPDLVARMTGANLCPVSLRVPIRPEGVGAPVPGSGPYYIAKFIPPPSEQVVLKRNPYYGGNRPHHVAQIVISGSPGSHADIVHDVEQNKVDGTDLITSNVLPELAARFRINRSRYRIVPGRIIWSLAFNESRPLFRNNARLRRAINFALDRKALVRTEGPGWGNTTDQYIPPKSPGFRNAQIYPLKQPNFAKARALAKGHLRGRKAVFYVDDVYAVPPIPQIVQQNLKRIGIAVEIKSMSLGELADRIGRPGEPWDLVIGGIEGQWMDPSWYLDVPLSTKGAANDQHFSSARFDRELRLANELSGDARYRAYARIDADVARTQAPSAVYAVQNTAYLFSERVGCIAANFYGWDIGAACLKRGPK